MSNINETRPGILDNKCPVCGILVNMDPTKPIQRYLVHMSEENRLIVWHRACADRVLLDHRQEWLEREADAEIKNTYETVSPLQDCEIKGCTNKAVWMIKEPGVYLCGQHKLDDERKERATRDKINRA